MGYDKDKVLTVKYLLYEFFGVAVLSVCYNMTKSYTYFLLVVSIWAWNHSGAHFNMAITLGELIVRSTNLDEFTKGISSFIAISFTQFIGSLFGILITFMISTVTYNGNFSKTVSPVVPTLCPSLGCEVDYLHWITFSSEFISSFALVLSFLLIRFEMFDPESSKWMTLVGPFVISFVYQGCT